MTKAEATVDLHLLFNVCDGKQGVETEYADDITSFLVDEVGDTKFAKSKWYERDGQTPMSQDSERSRLIQALNDLLDCIDERSSKGKAKAKVKAEDARIAAARTCLPLLPCSSPSRHQ